MRILLPDNGKGGRSGLPFAIASRIDARGVLRFTARACLALVLCMSLSAAQGAHGQRRNPRANGVPKQAGVRRPNLAGAIRENQIERARQKDAVTLLRSMLRPLVEYAAEETTWVAAQNGITSHQTLKGDTNGNVIRHYISPGFLQGDIMLTGPNRYVYYRAATKQVTRTPTGGQGDERDKQILEGLRNKAFVAAVTGNEMIAGRNAVIILVSAVNPQNRGYAKIWIDPMTHIKLKIEIGNAAGFKISDSEITSIQVGPAAAVTPKDFLPAEFGAAPAREIKRERVGSLQEAAGQLAFKPIEPANLPPGFRLQAAFVISPPNLNRAGQNGLLLRYTDGVSSFTLNEHLARRGAAAANRLAPDAPLRWEVGSVEVVYRGHLPAQQEQMIHDSLRPIN